MSGRRTSRVSVNSLSSLSSSRTGSSSRNSLRDVFQSNQVTPSLEFGAIASRAAQERSPTSARSSGDKVGGKSYRRPMSCESVDGNGKAGRATDRNGSHSDRIHNHAERIGNVAKADMEAILRGISDMDRKLDLICEALAVPGLPARFSSSESVGSVGMDLAAAVNPASEGELDIVVRPPPPPQPRRELAVASQWQDVSSDTASAMTQSISLTPHAREVYAGGANMAAGAAVARTSHHSNNRGARVSILPDSLASSSKVSVSINGGATASMSVNRSRLVHASAMAQAGSVSIRNVTKPPEEMDEFLSNDGEDGEGSSCESICEEDGVDEEEAERQVAELQRWYERLANEAMVLYTDRIFTIMQVSLGKENTMELDTLRMLVELLNGVASQNTVVDVGRKSIQVKSGITDRRSTRMNNKVSKVSDPLTKHKSHQQSLSLDAFCRLILFEGLSNFGASDLINVGLIREALVRNSVEHLILQYSHLKLPKHWLAQPSILSRMIEPTVGCMIILNALSMGFQADYSGWEGFRTLDIFFTCFFAGEILLKMKLYGFRNYMLGPEKYWNWFDILVVVLALVDLCLTEVVQQKGKALNNVTMFRVARLARLTKMMRLLRLLRLRIFKELALMVKGVIAGLRTLFWAIVLLICVAYGLGVVLRQTIGMDRLQMYDDYETVLFNSVPWSMFYVFRCVTSDCILPDGSPLVAHLQAMYGEIFVIPYVICVIFITFGIFNLIMATFVENVMEAARQRRQLSCEGEAVRVFTKLRTLVLKFGMPKDARLTALEMSRQSRVSCGTVSSDNDSTSFWDCFGWNEKPQETKIHFQYGGHITRETFEDVLEDQEAQELFDDLEVHISDRYDLFDVIDADNNGMIDVSELILGILKLRSGGADKSDMVAAILGIRAIQKQVGSVMDMTMSNQDAMDYLDIMLESHILRLEKVVGEHVNGRPSSKESNRAIEDTTTVLASV